MDAPEPLSPRACPLCSDLTSRIPLSIAPSVLRPPPYVQCQRCGLVFYDAPLAPPDERPLMQEEIVRYTALKLPINRERLNWLTRHASVPRGRAVDIGTKDGSAVKVLIDMGWQAIGYDPDRRFHEFAKQRYGVEIRPAWFTAETAGSGTLALVTAYHVFEHIPDPLPWLSEVWEALQPDGVLQIQTPNLNRIHLEQICFGHVVLYTAETLRSMVEKAGFKVLALTEYAPWGGDRTYDQLCVVAKRDRPKAIHFSLSERDRSAPLSLQRPTLGSPRSTVLPIRVYRGMKRRIQAAVGRARYRALR